MILEERKKGLVAPANRQIASAFCVELDLEKRDRSSRGFEFERGGVVPFSIRLRPFKAVQRPVDRVHQFDVLDCLFLLVEVDVGAVEGVIHKMRQNLVDVLLEVALEASRICERDSKNLAELLRGGLTDDLRRDLPTSLLDALCTDVAGRILCAGVVVARSFFRGVGVGG